MNINDILKRQGLKPGQAIFPGMQTDQSGMEAAQFLNKNGVKVRGQAFQSIIGTSEIDIRLSGDAKMMIGFKIISDKMSIFGIDPTVLMSLSVNNSVIIQDAPAEAYSPVNSGYSQKEWFEFVRSLSGSDNIKLVLTDNSVANYNIYFYYI